MTEQNRSLGMVGTATNWDDVPRWVRVAFFWISLLLAAGFCVKIGRFETVFVLLFAFHAGRLVDSLYHLKARGRESVPPTSISGDR